MHGLDDLKPQLRVTDATVECPVLGCEQTVARQRNQFKWAEPFVCPERSICISPSTWEYASEADNLLWCSPADLALLKAIKRDKREGRLQRDNSEDAVTFNVFRYLERRPEVLAAVLKDMAGETVTGAQLVYWSHHANSGEQWNHLNRARLIFGEVVAQGSEPDMIVISDGTLFFIEAKLNATNATTAPSLRAQKKYLTGADAWFHRVLNVDWDTVAVTGRRYELMRFWLLGTWLAADLGLKFRLVSLLTARHIARTPLDPFAGYAVQSDARRFGLHSWEQTWQTVSRTAEQDSDWQRLERYFLTKSIGYGSDRLLRPAFLRPAASA
jgi:Restriction Endonuclease associating with ARP